MALSPLEYAAALICDQDDKIISQLSWYNLLCTDHTFCSCPTEVTGESVITLRCTITHRKQQISSRITLEAVASLVVGLSNVTSRFV